MQLQIGQCRKRSYLLVAKSLKVRNDNIIGSVLSVRVDCERESTTATIVVTNADEDSPEHLSVLTRGVWSGTDGTHLQTLVGHMGTVFALAVGLDGKVYSGSCDTTIRVWSGDGGTHLQTLVGHTGDVFALAVGLDGKVYSGL
jgi:WD40 repeat protein